MKDNNVTNFKFLSKIYIGFKHKKLNYLVQKNKKLHFQIESQKTLIERKKQHLKQLIEQNSSVKNNYQNLINLFYSDYKTFAIPNNSYNISVFENVFIIKKISSYIIETKRNEEIYVFDEKLNDFLDYLLTLHYSVIVLSVETQKIVLKINIRV